jgi:hypothetical protein
MYIRTAGVKILDQFLDTFINERVDFSHINRGAWVSTDASQEAKDEILKYLKLYDLLDDYWVKKLMGKLGVHNTIIERRKQAIFDAYRETKMLEIN